MLLLLIVVTFLTLSATFADPEPPRCVNVPLKNCPSLFAIFKSIARQQNADSDTLELFQKRYKIKEFSDITVECCETTSCIDLLGLPGVCKNVYSCPALASQLRNPVPEVIRKIKQHKCVGPEEYSVCCSQTHSSLQINAEYSDSSKNKVADINDGGAERTNITCALTIPPDPRSGCCGRSVIDLQEKIYGGTNAAIGQYPWMARILYSGKIRTDSVCSGSLISDRYVLSAAHCFPSKSNFKAISVMLGQYDRRYSDLHCEGDCCTIPITKGIEKIITHEHYVTKGGNLGVNDIALIRMDGSIAFSDNISPICLPMFDRDYTKEMHRINLVAAGWGHIDNAHFSNVLQHVHLPYVDQRECIKYYERKVYVTSNQMCAGGAGVDTCKGDSGGPLMYESEHGFEVVGVVSLGPVDCATIPGLYTRVYPYKDWITKHVNNEDVVDDYYVTFDDE